MADFIVSMTLGGGQPWQKSVEVLDAQRNQAILLGIDRIMELCEAEDTPIASQAIAYWRTQRAQGGVLQEVLTGLEADHALTFKILEKATDAPVAQPRIKPSRNGSAPAKPLSLNDMLAQQLGLLQERQKELSSERRRIQDEYEENSASIQQITSFLMLAKPVKKRKKADAAAEAGDA